MPDKRSGQTRKIQVKFDVVIVPLASRPSLMASREAKPLAVKCRFALAAAQDASFSSAVHSQEAPSLKDTRWTELLKFYLLWPCRVAAGGASARRCA